MQQVAEHRWRKARAGAAAPYLTPLGYPGGSAEEESSDESDESDYEGPANDTVAGGGFRDRSLEHPVDLTVEDGA